jgi:hypothetical protein
MQDADVQLDDDLEPEDIEAYCVRCRQSAVMVNAVPVWTKRGAPGMRGDCEICGSTIFRMGRTEAHRGLIQPDVSQFREIASAGRKRSVSYATYVNFADDDLPLAAQVAEDLGRTGIPAWFDDNPRAADISWASGVHPALEDCTHMVLILSRAALADETVQRCWHYFRERRKPVCIVQKDSVGVPDALRWSPRIDFSGDYKTAFRELVQALASSSRS